METTVEGAAPKPLAAKQYSSRSVAERVRLALLCPDADDALCLLHPHNVRLVQGAQTKHTESPATCGAREGVRLAT